MNPAKKIFLTVLAAAAISQAQASCQSHRVTLQPFRDAESVVDSTTLKRYTDYLSSAVCEGRGTVQRGAVDAAWWISRRFAGLGLTPFGSTYSQSFRNAKGVCHNVIGMIPATRPANRDRYIIIGAHYDGIGMLDGAIYPGADSNASGVAALLGIADMFRYVAAMGGEIRQNIIFVAFDAKQLSLAGSENLWNRISRGMFRDPYSNRAINPRDITMMVNLDILGGNQAPAHKGFDDYLIMLGCKDADKILLHKCNRQGERYLDLSFDYYGSTGFTDMFLNKVSDQKVFREHGIYGVMFTSGITMDTNRLTDTPDKICPMLLEARTKIIYRWIWGKLADMK